MHRHYMQIHTFRIPLCTWLGALPVDDAQDEIEHLCLKLDLLALPHCTMWFYAIGITVSIHGQLINVPGSKQCSCCGAATDVAGAQPRGRSPSPSRPRGLPTQPQRDSSCSSEGESHGHRGAVRGSARARRSRAARLNVGAENSRMKRFGAEEATRRRRSERCLAL